MSKEPHLPNDISPTRPRRYPGTEEKGQKNELVLQSKRGWWLCRGRRGGREEITNERGRSLPEAMARFQRGNLETTWSVRETHRRDARDVDGSMAEYASGRKFLRNYSTDPLNFTSGKFHSRTRAPSCRPRNSLTTAKSIKASRSFSLSLSLSLFLRRHLEIYIRVNRR